MPWVFGYGSLVAAAGGVECSLRGFHRTWGVAMDNTVDLPGYKHYVEPASGERPRVCVAFLDIDEAGAGAEVNGLCRWVDDRDLPALDRRERNYRRTEVAERITSAALDPPVYTYVGLEPSRARAREGRCVVARAYLDAVRAGFAALGDEALRVFDRTTAEPPGPVLELDVVPHEG